LYDFDSAAGTYNINTKGFAGFTRPNDVLLPGSGYFIFNPTAADLTFTFVGEVVQGGSELATNPLPSGFAIRSSTWPASSDLASLSFPKSVGDVVYMYNNATSQYDIYTVGFGGNFNPVPTPAIGQAFFVRKNAATNWVQDFSVNTP
jgi:hypothetical protein